MTAPDVDKVTPEVRKAIAEIAAVHPNIGVDPDGDGGAYIVVKDMPLAPFYQQRQTWVGFHITYGYPQADVYPHFVRGDLRRVDDANLGDGTSLEKTFRGLAAIQISRRSNRLNPAVDTALLKLQKVIRWLNSL